MFYLTETQKELSEKFKKLKAEAGSHSPSIFTFKQKLPELDIRIDACFLSNPYATDLFLEYFKNEIIDTGKIRNLLEFYPSQNQVIAEILGKFLEINPQQIFVGNGAIEIIQAVVHNFVKRKIVINIPTFSSYYEFVKPNVEIVYNTLRKEDNFNLDVDDYIRFIHVQQPDSVVLINPNNPDGSYVKHNDLRKILEALETVDTVILDESFIHFAYEDSNFAPISTSKLVSEFPNLVIIKSMSKDFGIAGIRAGYAVMNADRVKNLLDHGFLWNSNGLSEYFFRLYTREDFAKDYEQVRKRYIADTIDFIDTLNSINEIKVYPSKANFVLVELNRKVKSIDFVTALLVKSGIYIRTCDDKIGLKGEFVRIASRTKEENQYMADSLRNIFHEALVN